MKFTSWEIFILGWLAIRAALDVALIAWKILGSR